MSEGSETPLLDQLEETLRPLSHGTEALTAIQEFSLKLPNTQARADLLNSTGALVTRPITCDEAVERGFYPPDQDLFWLLQGDIIHTEAAYSLGERITGGAKFILVSSTCDTVVGRKRTKVLLYEVHPIYKPESPEERRLIKSRLNTLLTFKERQYMYLPPLPNDDTDVIANVISFDDPAIARIEDILLAHRIASMSLPGWRILASLIRSNLTREGDFEAEMRGRFGGAEVNAPPTKSIRA